VGEWFVCGLFVCGVGWAGGEGGVAGGRARGQANGREWGGHTCGRLAYGSSCACALGKLGGERARVGCSTKRRMR
jgi:hypothetical protein